MKYTLTVQLGPEAVFGVPQDGVTVLPAAPGQFFGPSFHTDTLTQVGHGTPSRYRDDAAALRLDLSLGPVVVHVQDNFVFLDVEAPSHREALDVILNHLDRWLRHLSLTQGRLYKHRALILESDDRRTYPLPKYVTMVTVTSYDLGTVARDMTEAARLHEVADERLTRALEYLEDAQVLFEGRQALAPVTSRQHTRLIGVAFLTLWKAATAVVGDPSRDRDYQSRYRALGYEAEFLKRTLERLRALRDAQDVAHYSLSSTAIDEVEAQFGEAQQIVLDIIKRYRAVLASRP